MAGDNLAGSLKWTLAGNILNQALQFAIFVCLARLLTATDFGLVALAMLAIDLISSFTSAGIPAALVRKPELGPSDASSAFWLNSALSVAAAAAVGGLAPLCASLFRQPALTILIWSLALGLVISPLSSIHVALLERTMGFRALAVRSLLANLVGGLVGIVCALCGLGVWSLVMRSLTVTATMTVVVWWAMPWRPRLVYDRRAGAGLCSYGWRLLATDVVGQLNARGLELVVGLLISPASVGVLRVAGRIFGLLSQLTLNPVGMVALPALSQARGDPLQTKVLFQKFTGLSALLVFPVFLGMAAVADLAIPLLLGPKWALSALVTPGLCALILPMLFGLMLWACLAASGHASVALFWNILQLVVGLPAAILAARWGLGAIIVATIVRSYLLLPAGLWLLKRYADLDFVTALRPMVAPFFAAAVMGAVVMGLKVGLVSWFAPGWVLATLIPVGALVYAAILWFTAPHLARDFITGGDRSPFAPTLGALRPFWRVANSRR